MLEGSGLNNFKHNIHDIMSVTCMAAQSRRSVGEKIGSEVIDIKPTSCQILFLYPLILKDYGSVHSNIADNSELLPLFNLYSFQRTYLTHIC